MDPSLDSLITAAAPPVARRTPDLERELALLAAEAESAATPARRRLPGRIALSGLAALVVVGLGAGASAAGVLPAPAWVPWFEDPATVHRQTVSSGEVCEVAYDAKGIHDPQRPAGPVTRAAAVAAAEDFLRDFDFTTIDVAEAVTRVPRTAMPADAPAEELETFAVQLVLQERLDAELARRGLPRTVSVSAAQSCGGGS